MMADARQQHNNHGGQVVNNHPFRVQGIALVVDQKGKEPKLILRYPPTPPKGLVDEEDLFFRMDARQMAKLFRPKSSLCGEPVTLTIGVTIFCCRAVLLKAEKNRKEDTPADDNVNNNRIELFSILVALVPRAGEPSMASATGGWYEEERNIQGILRGASGQSSSSSSHSTKSTASFLAVVRVHVSLARICPVLESEEERCLFVTLQSLLCLETRKSFRLHMPQPPPPHSETSVAVPMPSSSIKPPSRSIHPSSSNDQLGANRLSLIDPITTTSLPVSMEYAAREQEILDAVMAANPPVDSQSGVTHQGNLVRELVQMFHALGRNEDEYAPTPLMVLGGEGVLYVNGHIAVAVEAVAPRTLGDRETIPVVRPYHTLLFPHTSTRDLLEALSSSSSSTPPQGVQQVLLSANPRKSISDMAADSSLSLQRTLDIATYLIVQGVGISSPVISRHSKLACIGIQQIHKATLPFSYAFGSDVDMFNLIAFLTTPGWTLGEAVFSLLSSEEMDVQHLRSKLRHCIDSRRTRTNPAYDASGTNNISSFGQIVNLSSMTFVDEQTEIELEEILYDMASWLCGRRVVVHIQDYMVETMVHADTSGADSNTDDVGALLLDRKEVHLSTTTPTTEATASTFRMGVTDEALLRELRAADCLSGRISFPAVSWRLGVDMARLRSFATRHPSVQLLTRPAAPGDDWIPVSNDPTTVLNELRKQ